MRGRLNVEAQAARCFGAVDQLHVMTFEYEEGSWENLVCGAALAAAAGQVSDPLLKHPLDVVAKDFAAPLRIPDALPLLARGRYSVLNDHYRPAHAWARMVLGGSGPKRSTGPVRIQGARAVAQTGRSLGERGPAHGGRGSSRCR
ncbi:hypothetical protein ACFWMU_18420 [Streptomyces sp. NPDC058357]|uniref:5-methylcytosine restriction system specificity protein McrC n=1 Tax=unclassified Streptomyces TaxID=2593676 RepID=UPI00364DB053